MGLTLKGAGDDSLQLSLSGSGADSAFPGREGQWTAGETSERLLCFRGPGWRRISAFGNSNAFGSIPLPKWHVSGWHVLGRSGRALPPGFCVPSNRTLQCQAFGA